MSRGITASSAFWIGSYLGGGWDCDGGIGDLSHALIQNHSIKSCKEKNLCTACCMTKHPLAFYCTNDTAITPTCAKSFESLRFERYLNNICNSILPVVVILLI